MEDKTHMAVRNTILRGVVGSTAHGTNVVGEDDTDEMGVFIEPPVYVCGLSRCDHFMYRDKPDGVRSEAGDLDLIIYSLRRFCHLAAEGNPSILLLLFLSKYTEKNIFGQRLIDIRHQFLSRDAGKRFLGYLTAQKERMLGLKTRKVSRPELVEKYGYDTKFAMHAMRLGMQGIELLTTGHISLPVREPDLTKLREVRTGMLDFETCVNVITHLQLELFKLIDECKWKCEYRNINRFLVQSHQDYWDYYSREEENAA